MICEREEEIAAFKPQEYWTIEAPKATHQRRRPFPLQADRVSAARRSSSSASPTRPRRARSSRHDRATPARAATLHASRQPSIKQAAPPQSGPAVHDLDAAAGSRAQARLQRQPHDAARAAAVRRRGHRRRQRRPHHLHAYRLGERSPTRRSREMREVAGRAVRQGRAARRAARLQDQIEERAGSARGDPPDVRRDHAGGRRAASSTPTVGCTRSIWKRAVASQMSHAVFDTVAVDMLAGRRRRASATCCAPTARRW